MKYLVADIETESLDKSSKIHCICSKDFETKEDRVWLNNQVKDFVAYANTFDFIIFHNGIRFDYQVLLPYGLKCKIRDTLIDSKICFPKEWLRLIDVRKNTPSNLVGTYSIKAWGNRFGLDKLDFTDFTEVSDEMIKYCKRDVDITEKLFQLCQSSNLLPKYETLFCEYRTAYLMDKQEDYGFYFDKDKALEYYSQMYQRQLELEKLLKQEFGVVIERGEVVTPKKPANPYTTKAKAPKVGPYQKIKLQEFNPKSRKQIYERLEARGIELDSFTEKGTHKVTEEVLETHNLSNLQEYLKLSKDISQLMGNLTENSKGLIALSKDNRLHGYVDYLSCATHRASHSSPNITQVPKTKEFRGLFVSPPNRKLIGIDADQLELMILGFWLEKFGNKEYLKSVATGSKANGDDVHTRTQHLVGLETRDKAKTFSYATLYGAGGLKLGLSLNPSLDFEYTKDEYNRHKRQVLSKLQKINNKDLVKVEANTFVPYNENMILYSIYGTQKKDLFINGTDGMQELISHLETEIDIEKAITSLDGRKIYSTTKHKALNYLCQSSGAIFMKYYLCETYKQLKKYLKLNEDYAYVANIHDALVIEANDDKDTLELICKILDNSFIEVSNVFGFSYPIRGFSKIGSNFYDIFKD